MAKPLRALTVLLVASLGACGDPVPPTLELTGSTMGTWYSVKIPANNFAGERAELQGQVETLLDTLNTQMSTWVDSELLRFNAVRSTEWQSVSAAFCRYVDAAGTVSALTDGGFDITVGPLVDLWGFGPDGRIDNIPTEAVIAATLARTGYRHLETDCEQPALRKSVPELALDMSAFGKGLAVDELGKLLDAEQVDNYLLEVGGEIRVRGRNAAGELWAIGIEAPLAERREPWTIVRLTDSAVATSGDYRNYLEVDGQRYSHTIDTRTGKPVQHDLASVTVVAHWGWQADALATGLLVLGPERALQIAAQEDLAVLLLSRRDGELIEQTSAAFDQLRRST